MNTFQEQQAFFEETWPELKQALETGGAEAAVDYIESFDDDLARRVLYVHARSGMVMGDWQGKAFEPYVAVCDAGIAEMLGQADAAQDDETRAARTRGAHIVSFNLAADLAACWPGDDEPRTAQHFERGLRAANDCIGWCAPGKLQALSTDWWVKGMHELSLGRAADAQASWLKSLEIATEAAKEEGAPTTLSSDTGFGIVLATGYVGIGAAASGDAAGRNLLDQALDTFRAQLDDEQRRDDAQFGIDQLEKVRDAYLS